MFEPCVTTELGEPVMSGDTRLKCNSAAYEFHSIFAWLALLSFGIGIPLGVVLLVKYLKRKRVLNKGEVRKKLYLALAPLFKNILNN